MLIKKPKVSKLGLVVLGYLAFAFAVALFSFAIFTNSAASLHSNFVSSNRHYEAVLHSIVDDLQTKINQEHLQSTDYITLYQWSKSYPSAGIQIEKEDTLIFDSGFSQADLEYFDPIANKTSSKQYPLHFTDGAATANIFLFAGEKVYILINFISFAASAILFLFLFIILLQRKIHDIIAIDRVVQGYEGGLLEARLQIDGNDELSNLANNINRMAGALEQQISNEVALRNSNSALVSSLAHDIRTPLTAIISYLEIIQSDKYEHSQKEKYLAIISDKAEQIKGLTDDLFDYFSTQQQTPTQLSRVAGQEFTCELAQETGELLRDEGYTVTLDNRVKQDFLLSIDEILFQRIWDNLYSNLQKYADPAQPIELTFELFAAELAIKIRNTKKAADSTIESNGIGLANCTAIAEKLGWKFIVTDSGNCFETQLILPLSSDTQDFTLRSL